MEHCVENNLKAFEYHDSEWALISWQNDNLMFVAEYLNAKKEIVSNDAVFDMAIDNAKITFYNASIKELELSYSVRVGNKPGRRDIISDGDLKQKVLQYFETKPRISCLYEENDYCAIEMLHNNDDYVLLVRLSYDRVTIEWDDFKLPAWYEWINSADNNLVIETPEGDINCYARILHHDDENSSSVYIDIWNHVANIFGVGSGNCYTWEDAFADLQKKLPNGMSLKCCMTCRHGNFCIFGDEPNKIYCMKDVAVKNKYDLVPYMQDEQEVTARVCKCTDFCECFEKQSKDVFTYNGYLDYLG